MNAKNDVIQKHSWSELKRKGNISWPKFDSKLTVDDDIAFVIQVNGKKRGLILSKRDTDQKKLFMMKHIIKRKPYPHLELLWKIFVYNQMF